MVVTASPARVAAILAGSLGVALLLPGGASVVESSASVRMAISMASMVHPTKIQPLLAQADDLAPPSPDAIVTTPPPAPFAENVPPPLPGYAWDPGHWAWDGGQYVWQPGNYLIQPTYGASFTPGFWQQYSAGWAWVDGRWSWGTQGEGE